MHKPLKIVCGRLERSEDEILPGDLLALHAGLQNSGWTGNIYDLVTTRDHGSPYKIINVSWLKKSPGQWDDSKWDVIGYFTFLTTVMYPLEKKRDGTQRLVKTPVYFNDELGNVIVIGGNGALIQIA